jgi:uroporphyrinogen-III synthase
MTAALRVLVTRPAAQAGDWVARLQAEGFLAAALPLMGIVPVDDPAPVAAAWRALPGQDLAMFVSPNAVAHFFARRPPGCDWPAALQAAAPGPGTGAALRAAGVPPGQVTEPAADAASFDSESLWAQLRLRGPWAGRSVLILRGGAQGDGRSESGKSGMTPDADPSGLAGRESEEGGEGREWLTATLRGEGARVQALATYRRGLPQWDEAALAVWRQALAAPSHHLWWFSSSEAIGHLQALAARHAPVPGPSAPALATVTPPALSVAAAPWAGSLALVTHPRIAEAARQAGFGEVCEVAPAATAVLAALRAIVARSSEQPSAPGAPIESIPL